MVKRVTLVGTLPPIKSISFYCLELTQALIEQVDVEFINFKHIYWEALYKGGGTKETDPVFKRPVSPRLVVRDLLTWYNPLSWLYAGVTASGEILHFQWLTSYQFPVYFSIALVTKARRKKMVCTVHNVHGHETGIVDRVLNRLIFSLPDMFFVHTERNREQLHSAFGIPLAKIRVVPMGIFEFYRDEELTQAQARQRLGVPVGAKILLCFGHIRPYKGIEDLIAAYKLARRTVPNLFLMIVGKPWNQELQGEIERELADVPDKYLNFGYVPSSQIKEFFSAADAVVLPYREFSAQSGPGNVALAFEKPLIVSDVGGLPELVANPKAVFEAGNVPALAAAIEHCVGDDEVLAALAKDSARLREHFSWRASTKEAIRAYNEL
jgi:glycosyltransferase involved in cell wall biosynthesis